MTVPRALVLTAGLGTRLRPLTYVRAKAAVPVNGEPLAVRVIRWLVSHGITDLVLNLHHRPETIAACVGDGRGLGARVRYSWEDPILGSAGGPRHALPLLTDGTSAPSFLLVNGDTLTDVDVRALLAVHEQSGADVTMALIPNPRPEHYGGVAVSDEGWVTGFTRPGGPPSYHFIGVQAARARVFADLEDGVPAESVNSLYPRLLVRNRHAIRAFVCEASFRDIGTTADYFRTSIELSAIEGNRLLSGSGLCIEDSARVISTVVWDDVVIGRDAELVECIVCDGVRIPPRVRHERSAIVAAGGELLVSPIDL